MNNIAINKNNYFEKGLALFVLGMLVFSILPLNVYAQLPSGMSGAPGTGQTDIEQSEAQIKGIQAAHDSIANASSCFVSPTACISKFLAGAGTLVLQGFGGLLTLSGKLFDASAEKALEQETYSGQKIQILQNGWTTVRDISNLFFIFILLIIAIATILRLEAYGVKTLLPRLIIIALLINFSFLFTTRYIIRPSNELAKVFYEQSKKLDKGGENSISAAFVNGLDTYKVYTKLEEGEIARQGLVANSIFVFLSTMGGSILIILAAFVLFAAAIMFIMRIVILWILIILSPLAFLFMVLPATRGYASSWWKQLFNQSFFPIAFLFLFYLVVSIINGGTGGGSTIASLFGGNSWADYILQYAFLLILLFLTLIVSKNLGAYGANTMIGWAKTGRRWATGYAGRLGARNLYARPMRKLQESTKGARESLATMFPRTAGALSRGLERAAKVGGLEDITKKRMEFGRKLPPAQAADYFKKLGMRELGLATEEFSAREVAEMRDKASAQTQSAINTAIERLPAERREAIAKEGANLELKRSDKEIANRFTGLPTSIKRSLLEQADKGRIQKIANAAEDEGVAKEFIDQLQSKEIEDIGEKKIGDVLSVLPHMAKEAGKNFADIVKDIDFEKVKAEHITGNAELMDKVVARATPKNIEKIIKRGDALMKEYINRVQVAGNAQDFAEHLRREGNEGTAKWIEINRQAQMMLGLKSKR